MAYSVYILEEFSEDNYIELDVEDVDFSTTFSIADIQDISKRKDKITKQIAFKGSPTNNQAFGSLFHQNQIADTNLTNRLFFNYNPLRTVTCLIYEDSVLLLRGELRVLEIQADKSGNIVYQTFVTGSFIDFKFLIDGLKLEDLNLSDMQHRYTWNNIANSWSIRTESYNPVTNTYSYIYFEKGKRFVYPFIDYGVTYKKENAVENGDSNHINGLNFRPAIFVKEYVNRIFDQDVLSGYTYEIKGDAAFLDRFDSLLIPDTQDKLDNKTDLQLALSKSILVTNENNSNNHDLTFKEKSKLLQYNNIPINPLLSRYGNNLGIVSTLKTFDSDASVNVIFSNVFNGSSKRIKVNVEVVDRGFNNSSSSNVGWGVIASSSFELAGNTGTGGQKQVKVDVSNRTWLANRQIAVRLRLEAIEPLSVFPLEDLNRLVYNIDNNVWSFPKDTTSAISINLNLNDDDIIKPKAPSNILQFDFIKSLLATMNLFVYTEKSNPKHLIFERYDDYYALTSSTLLPVTALNWSKKIDYSNGFKIKSNIEIPKKYLFTMKTDGDYLNSDYKTKYGEVYGQFNFNDAYGLTDEKKVETVFSPSPLVTYSNNSRIHPAIYQIDGVDKKPFKSNIRLLYYNGLKISSPQFSVGKDISDGTTYDIQTVAINQSMYASVGNYFLGPGYGNLQPTHDLNFGKPKQIYFNGTTEHENCPTAYQDYYINQVSDLTNPNVSIIECNVRLNEIDIGNLDLKIPVFVDFGQFGHAYFKVISIEYDNNTSFSKCVLQKIVMS